MPVSPSPQRIRRPRQIRRDRAGNGVSTLVGLCMLSVMILGLVLAHVASENNADFWESLLVDARRHFDRGQARDVGLALTPDRVRRDYPKSSLSRRPSGEMVARYEADGGQYVVWFPTGTASERAYRLRFDRIYHGRPESEVVADLATRFGPPSASGCERLAIGRFNRCEYRWMLNRGVTVDLVTRAEPGRASPPRTAITLMALDTFQDPRQDPRRRPAPDHGAGARL